MTDVNETCTVVYGDIIVNGSTDYTFAQLFEKLSNIEHIYGRMFLIGTNYNNFSFLSSLQSIHYEPDTDQRTSYQQQTILLESNHELKDLGMPNLMSITIKALVEDSRFFASVIVDNPLLCVPVHQIESWLLSGRVFVPRMFYCGIQIIEENIYYKKFKVENSSKIYCSMDWFNASMPAGCQVLDQGIWVAYLQNETECDRFSKYIESVEYVIGPIVIRDTKVKTLNFPNLKTIYNMVYDNTEHTGWGYQVMQFQTNPYLTEITFPKLEKIYHYGYDVFMKMSNNPILKCAPDTCETFLSLYRFELDSCSCGVIPNFNEGYSKMFFAITIVEATVCAVLTLALYGNVMINVYKSGFSVSYFQFSMLVYFVLSCMEAVHNVLNNIKALLSFIFCGFPDGVIDFREDRFALNRFLRTKKVFEYHYGSIIIRWHYMVYAILIRFFLHAMLAKVDIRSDAVITERIPRYAVAPAKPVQGIP